MKLYETESSIHDLQSNISAHLPMPCLLLMCDMMRTIPLLYQSKQTARRWKKTSSRTVWTAL